MPSRSPPRFVTLALITGLAVLSFNMMAPSLGAIAAEFQSGVGLTSFAISGFLAVNAVLYLVLGPLSDRFGRRPVMLWSLGGFVLASAGAAVAPDIGTFLAFRTLQASVIAGSVISGAVVRDTSPPDEAASRLGYLAMAMAIGPMIGPVVGGLLDQTFGWRAIFWAYALGGSGVFALVWLDMGETNINRASTFAAQVRQWPQLLGSATFWAYALVMASGIGVFYIFISGVPFVNARALGLSPAMLGIGLGSITGGFFLGSFLSGRVAVRMGIVRMIIAGRVVALVGVGGVLVLYAAGIFTPLLLFLAAIAAGIGNGVTTPSARAGSMAAVGPELAGTASGLGGALIVAVGAALTQLTGMVIGYGAPVPMLLGIMCVFCAFGLALACWVRALHARTA